MLKAFRTAEASRHGHPHSPDLAGARAPPLISVCLKPAPQLLRALVSASREEITGTSAMWLGKFNVVMYTSTGHNPGVSVSAYCPPDSGVFSWPRGRAHSAFTCPEERFCLPRPGDKHSAYESSEVAPVTLRFCPDLSSGFSPVVKVVVPRF